MKKGDKITIYVDRSQGDVEGIAALKDGCYAGIIKDQLQNGNWIVGLDERRYPVFVVNRETLRAETGNNSTGVWIDEN